MHALQDSSRQQHARYIQLDARNVEGQVTVTPKDQDRFMLQVSEAIKGCQHIHAVNQARERFDLLLKQIAAWVLPRSDVRDAILTTRDGELCFIAVHSTPGYSAEFEDALSELDLQIANDPDIRLPVSVLSLPPVSEEALRSFLSTELALRFSGAR